MKSVFHCVVCVRKYITSRETTTKEANTLNSFQRIFSKASKNLITSIFEKIHT